MSEVRPGPGRPRIHTEPRTRTTTRFPQGLYERLETSAAARGGAWSINDEVTERCERSFADPTTQGVPAWVVRELTGLVSHVADVERRAERLAQECTRLHEEAAQAQQTLAGLLAQLNTGA
jgi:hypothetical protein